MRSVAEYDLLISLSSHIFSTLLPSVNLDCISVSYTTNCCVDRERRVLFPALVAGQTEKALELGRITNNNRSHSVTSIPGAIKYI